MNGKIFKGKFVCEDCKKNQIWVYQEIKPTNNPRRDGIILYERLKNEVMVGHFSADKKTGLVYCSDGRCGYPNTVNLEDVIQSKL